jgi:Tfp pilus assembly protein PilF
VAGQRPLGYDCLKVNSFFKQGGCDDACMKAGKKELAIESYERALALDPSQENPRKMLRELRQE